MRASTWCGALLFLVVVGVATADEPTLSISQVQGDGASSPHDGQWVRVAEAVVTAAGGGVFFVQSPDGGGDGDPATSDGLAVLSWAAVAVGDLVELRGRVQEYYDLTRLVGVTATVTASGQPLPAAVAFDAVLPSPDPVAAEATLERLEGMRVAVAAGTVCGPTDQYGDAAAVATATRLFREPGIAYPGLPELPVWDGNPEGFELAPSALGGPDRALAAGSRFTAVGVLGQAFGDFQLWPTELTVLSEPSLPRAVRPPLPDELRVASQNLLRLGAGSSDALRRGKLSRQVREVMGAPEVVAVQEAIGFAALSALAERIAADDPTLVYTPLLVDSSSDIEVGFLVRDPVLVRSLTQIGAQAQMSTGGRLFDRPPLVLELAAGERELTVVAVHLRSLIDVDDPSQGSFVRRKRHEGAVWLSRWLNDRLVADPDEALVVVGDFNAYQFSDGYVDVVGQVSGAPDPAGALLPASDELDPDLVNALALLPAAERYSYVFDGNAQAIDHVLLSPAAAAELRAVAYTRGNADVPSARAAEADSAARCSDHDGVVAYFGGPRQRPGGRRQR